MIPTPIQGQGVPIGLRGQNLVGIAQTGSGKTLAVSCFVFVEFRTILLSIYLILSICCPHLFTS